MFAALSKLLAGSAAILGPFLGGMAIFAAVPEKSVFFAIVGCAIGVAGLVAHARIEALEERQFLQRLGEEG